MCWRDAKWFVIQNLVLTEEFVWKIFSPGSIRVIANSRHITDKDAKKVQKDNQSNA
jgi:hypothetical protein